MDAKIEARKSYACKGGEADARWTPGIVGLL
jgi:hypothetical protein